MIGLRPGRIALYHFAHLPESHPYQRNFRAESMPDSDAKMALFLLARKLLAEAGYQAIGLDHFALPGDDLSKAFLEGSMQRNFMGYTTQSGQDLLGFGLSAISDCGGAYWQNEKKLVRYTRGLASGQLPIVRGLRLDSEDQLRRKVIGNLFCAGGVDFETVSREFGVDFHQHFQQELAELTPLSGDGFLVLDDNSIQVTNRGQLFLRNIAMVFDAHLRQSGAPVTFSRSV